MIRFSHALTCALIAWISTSCSATPNRAVDDTARAAPATALDPVAVAEDTQPAATEGTATPSDDVSVAWPRSVDGSADMTIARVGGRDIPLNELVSKWIMRDPDGVRGLLDDIVLSRIVVIEAAGYGLEPPAKEVERTVRERLKILEGRARTSGAPDLETFIRMRLGFEPEVFMRNLEEESAIDRLAPRCVRAWILGNDRREVRAITVMDQAGVDQVQARLARGDAFADVAKDLSTDASKDEGGRVPPLVRGQSTLARTAFATEVGLVAGPIEEGGAFLFVLVEAEPPVIEGSWAQIGAAVEASLVERDVEDPEFWQWKEAMSSRHDVDISPFLDLVR